MRWLAAVFFGLLVVPTAGSAADRAVVTVFAAASLTDVLQAIGDDYTADTGVPLRFSFAATSALARQIEAGAGADVFVSADQEWMDYLAERGLIAPATRVDVVANRLVLIAPRDSVVSLRIAPGFALAAALGGTGRLATGDPGSVPVGRYARDALQRLGIWWSVEKRLVAADNTRTALNFVARGEAPLGIVYATDARSEGRVRVVDTFPKNLAAPITYPAAATSMAAAEGAAFVRFLSSAKARARFDDAGFDRP